MSMPSPEENNQTVRIRPACGNDAEFLNRLMNCPAVLEYHRFTPTGTGCNHTD